MCHGFLMLMSTVLFLGHMACGMVRPKKHETFSMLAFWASIYWVTHARVPYVSFRLGVHLEFPIDLLPDRLPCIMHDAHICPDLGPWATAVEGQPALRSIRRRSQRRRHFGTGEAAVFVAIFRVPFFDALDCASGIALLHEVGKGLV